MHFLWFDTFSSSVSEREEKREKDQMKQFQVEQKFADRRYKVVSAKTYFYLNEATCEKNMEAFLKSIDAVAGNKVELIIIIIRTSCHGIVFSMRIFITRPLRHNGSLTDIKFCKKKHRLHF